MRKLISVLLILSMLVCMIPAISITSFAEGASITPDQSWYNASEPEYYIYDAADLLGLGAMLAYHDGTSAVYNNAFLGKTIHIMNDIDLNPGWDASAGTKPTNVWPKLAHSREFAGTIDGHGHTISGVYQINEDYWAGMFGNVNGKSVTVRDLAIKNSYFENNNSNAHGVLFGFIKGSSVATFENIYVDATLVNTDAAVVTTEYGIGGIIGGVETGDLSMKNCVFEGTVTLKNKVSSGITYIGGMLGRYNGSTNCLIENCASYATFNAETTNGAILMMGGIVGYQSAAEKTVDIENCISHCTFNKTTDTASQIICGSIVGAARYNSAGSFAKTFFTNNFCVDNANYSGKYRILGCVFDQNNTKSYTNDPASGTKYYTDVIGSTNASHGTKVAEITGEAATAYLSGKGYTGWTATETYPLPTTVVNMLTTHVTEVIGYQAMAAEGGKFNFRIVGVFNLEEGKTLKDYELVGFEASATYGGSTQDKTYTSNTVYTSISGDDTTGLVEYKASDFGGDYFFVMPCLDFPEPAAGTSVVVKIKSFYKLAGAESTTPSETDWITVNVAPPKDHVN